MKWPTKKSVIDFAAENSFHLSNKEIVESPSKKEWGIRVNGKHHQLKKKNGTESGLLEFLKAFKEK